MADPKTVRIAPSALRTARRRRDLTQLELGRMIDPPINHTLISRYESGLRVPVGTLVQLAKILRLEIYVRPPKAVRCQS